jgi:carboxyl-terminal processing protease
MIKKFVVLVLAISTFSLANADDRTSEETSYAAVAVAISETMRANHYDPAELDDPRYRKIEAAVADLAQRALSDEAFVDGFREAWENGPFSHVEFRTARQSADDLAAYLDNLRVGGGGAVLTWEEDIAILTVNTMMGLDTIEQINAAYAEIAATDTHALIIDLRANGGGAFAVRPLVAHLIDETVDAGGFVSQRWNAEYNRGPNARDIQTVEPWDGWSIRAFWADVQDEAITRISITPSEPKFSGSVYVLTSEVTASAAELAADVLKGSGRAILIGEKTAGQMLSQKIYDVPGGFQLSLPIADYYSIHNGRIEGVGVNPDIDSNAADALDIAIQQAKKHL